jgi:hypothetical protein
MASYVANVPIKSVSGTVTAGTPLYLETINFPFPMTVVAKPGASGTLLVEYSCTPNAAGLTTSATWLSWPSGTVSVNTSDSLVSPVTALRFTATTSNGTYEVVS